MEEVNKNWGGSFEVILGRPWKRVLEEAKAEDRKIVHLTMYGIPLQDVVTTLRGMEKLLVVVGGPKVPGQVYHSADYNVSVTSQPHSEIAALAITLHEVQGGEELKRSFGKSKLRIIPSARGKRVMRD